MANLLAGAQIPIRPSGCKKCPCPDGKEVIYVCEKCNELACTVCATNRHKGHDLESISKIIPEVKCCLEDFISNAEQHDIPRIKKEMQVVDFDLLNSAKHYQEQIETVQSQNATLKRALDSIAEKVVKSYRDMEDETIEKLVTYKLKLSMQSDERDASMQKVRDILQSANDVLIYDFSRTLSFKSDQIPQPETSRLGDFAPGTNYLPKLEQLLGEVLSSKSEAIGSSQSNEQVQPAVVYQEISPQFAPFAAENVKSMHSGSDDRVLVCGGHNEISVIDQKGIVHQTLAQDGGIRDFCLSPTSEDIWFIGYDNGVRKVKGLAPDTQNLYGVISSTKNFLGYGNGEGKVDVKSRTTMKFTTQKEPISICMTSDDHIVMGHVGQLVKYTQSGDVITQSSPKGWLSPPAVRYPRRVTECPATYNLAVVDWEGKNGGNSPAVKILNRMLKMVLFTFCGEGPTYQSPTSPFNPWDVCYTNDCELIVTDWNNKSVSVLSSTGVYKHTLYINNDSQPQSVCVVKGNKVFVSFADRNVQILQQLKNTK